MDIPEVSCDEHDETRVVPASRQPPNVDPPFNANPRLQQWKTIALPSLMAIPDQGIYSHRVLVGANRSLKFLSDERS